MNSEPMVTIPARVYMDLVALSRGYDRRGPDWGVSWEGKNGIPCTCEWSSVYHGSICPEHNKIGIPICVPIDSDF